MINLPSQGFNNSCNKLNSGARQVVLEHFSYFVCFYVAMYDLKHNWRLYFARVNCEQHLAFEIFRASNIFQK